MCFQNNWMMSSGRRALHRSRAQHTSIVPDPPPWRSCIEPVDRRACRARRRARYAPEPTSPPPPNPWVGKSHPPRVDPHRRSHANIQPSPAYQALGPGSYGGARERDPVRGAPFGTARRDTGMVRPGRVPGPGTYGDLSVMGIGAQTTTIARSQTKGFGGGPRLAPDTALKSPGPGTYYDHKANLWIKRVGSGRDQSATGVGPTGRTLSATNRRALFSSSADRPPSAAPPSIPARAQSHGYEPSPDDTSRDMIPTVPTTRDTYSGRGDDRIGPDRYSPGVVAGSMKGVDPHKTTDFASSKAKRRPVPDEPARSPGTRYLDEVKTRLAPMAYAGGRDERVSRDSFKESIDAETDPDEASDAEKTREIVSSTTRSVRKPSTAGFAAVRRGSASRQSASRRKPSATKQTPGPGEYVTNVSGFDRTRSPSRVQALGGTERGHRHGAEAVPSRGPSRSSAWDDDIASPGANRMNSTASSPSPYDAESPRLVLDATGRSDDFDTLGRTSRASSAGGRYLSRPQTGFGTGKRSSLSARSHSPGPGAYEVKLASALSPSSRKGTFGRSMSGGDLVGMGTGTTNGGVNGGIDSPGPGHYDAHAGREVPSSPSTKSHVVGGFVTAARRNDSTLGNTFVRGRSAGTGGGGGGVGTRDAASNNNAPRTPNRGFGRQAARGKGYDANPVANFPGPGSYDWMYGENDAWERRRIVNETSGTLRLNGSTGVGLFGTGPRIAGTNSASHDGPNGAASPGPGHYALDSGADRGRIGGGGGRSSFRSGTVRGGDPAFRGGPSPGPARYYPDDTIVRRSYNVTAR